MPGEPFEPFDDGDAQRGSDGRFRPGNRGGPGNPRAQHARQLRQRLDEALFKVAAPDRLVNVVDSLLKAAEAGDIAAIRLVFDRLMGPVVDAATAERIENLEQQLSERARV